MAEPSAYVVVVEVNTLVAKEVMGGVGSKGEVEPNHLVAHLKPADPKSPLILTKNGVDPDHLVTLLRPAGPQRPFVLLNLAGLERPVISLPVSLNLLPVLVTILPIYYLTPVTAGYTVELVVPK